MAKTDFSNGTVVSSAWLDSVFFTGGGHKHDGGLNDGSAGQISLTGEVVGILPRENYQPPRGFIDGLTLSYSQVGDSWKIAFAAGSTVSGGGGFRMSNINPATKIVIDAAGTGFSDWVAGNNQGGVADGLTPSDGLWLHAFLVHNGTTSFDYGFDTSPVAANLLTDTGYLYYRRVGSIKIASLGGGKFGIVPFVQTGDRFLWTPVVVDYSGSNIAVATSVTTLSLSVPPDVNVLAALNVWGTCASNWGQHIWDGPLGATYNAINGVYIYGDATKQVANAADFLTGTSRQIYACETIAGVASQITIGTRGWLDPRGRDL